MGDLVATAVAGIFMLIQPNLISPNTNTIVFEGNAELFEILILPATGFWMCAAFIGKFLLAKVHEKFPKTAFLREYGIAHTLVISATLLANSDESTSEVCLTVAKISCVQVILKSVLRLHHPKIAAMG